ncbi:hypothetical protein AVEN_161206-1 [Araneus ventricosus]|uniref:Chromo domain-containing protein n=1 Tax=Araneus ventricosus TaxID=182803 RepID=A0A4Y2MEL7_ARAVE|nr:hypothetical protein AVEN_161206-1 [Araneus ventricosus]
MEPSSVNIDNQAEVWHNLYGDISKQKSEKSSFKVDYTVRISKWKERFGKGYEYNWSREIFTVHKIVPRIPTVYRLRDFHNNVIEGTFYEKEMQKVVDSGYYPVKKVTKKRKRNGEIEYFVKFQGYSDEFNAQVDVSLNDRLVSNSSNTYTYRSYIETLLNHGFDNKTSHLTSEMFYKDNDNGLEKQSKFFDSRATVDMIGGIHSDLFHQERLLMNLVDVKIKLIRSNPEFCLQGTEGHKVVSEKISLLVRKVRVSAGVILGHMKSSEKETAKYPINKILCKVYFVPHGNAKMKNILQRKDLLESEKANQYLQVLQKFIKIQHPQQKAETTEIQETSIPENQEPGTVPEEDVITTKILKTAPVR